MPRYIVHIGPQKTGSTTLQTSLGEMAPQLAARGILFPMDWLGNGSRKPHHVLGEPLSSGHHPALEQTFAEIGRSAAYSTVVLSYEDMCTLPDRGLIYLRRLIGEASQVDLVYYVRRWSERTLSQWKQAVWMGGRQTLPEFLARATDRPLANPNENPALVWDRFANIFGRDRLHIVSFNNLIDAKSDLFLHFMETFVGWRPDASPQGAVDFKSPDAIGVEIMRALNAVHAETGLPFDDLPSRFHARKHKIDISLLSDAMQADMENIIIDDNSSYYKNVWKAMEVYADRLTNPDPQHGFFRRTRASCPYVRQNYLLRPGVVERLHRLYDELRKAAGAAKPLLPSLGPAGTADTGSAIAPLATGRRVVFGTGWSAPEQEEVWAVGGECSLTIPLPDAAAPLRLTLGLRAFVLETRHPAQRLRISVNGADFAEHRIDTHQGTTLSLRLPAETLAGQNELRILIRMPDAKAPSDFGFGDQRVLAFALRSVTLDSADGRTVWQSKAGDANWGKPAPKPAPALALRDLMARFESLGENCEFGLVQRRCGAEPLGLLRFSSTPLGPLIAGLRARFAGMADPGNLEVEVSENGREYMVRDRRFGFRYHAWVNVGDAAPAEIGERERRRLPLLIRKLIEDLTEGSKLFVYHGMTPLTAGQAAELAAALQTYGPGTLLWVELADAANLPGSVRRVAPGVLKGHIDRFAPGENAHDLSLDCWVQLCGNALALAGGV